MIGKIETGQFFQLSNVIHYHGKLTPQKATQLSNQIDTLLAVNQAEKLANTVTITNNISVENGRQVIDVDLFFPVSKKLDVTEGLDFLETFTVKNALKVRVQGSPAQIEQAMILLADYIKKRNCVPIHRPVW